LRQLSRERVLTGRQAPVASVEAGTGVLDHAAGDRIVTLNAAGSHGSKGAVPATSTWPIADGLDTPNKDLVYDGTSYEHRWYISGRSPDAEKPEALPV
jgi:hypothetical protein